METQSNRKRPPVSVILAEPEYLYCNVHHLGKTVRIMVDHADRAMLNFRWHIDKSGYSRRHISKEEVRNPNPALPSEILLHHMLLPRKPGFIRAHIDGNKLNCCRKNLIYVSHSNAGRQRAKSIPNKLGIRGVRLHPKTGKYIPTIKVMGKQIHLGCFDTSAEASEAYWTAARAAMDLT